MGLLDFLKKPDKAGFDLDNVGDIILDVSRKQVEDCDIDDLLKSLSVYLKNKENVIKGREKTAISFSGYDDDPRELYEIPEVRKYVSALDAAFPYLFYFCSLSYPTLRVFAMCTCKVTKVAGGVIFDQKDLQNFLLYHIQYLNELCSTYNLGEAIANQVTDEVLSYFSP
jgi:hypothetical protein